MKKRRLSIKSIAITLSLLMIVSFALVASLPASRARQANVLQASQGVDMHSGGVTFSNSLAYLRARNQTNVPIDAPASFTVIAHGFNSSASAWSNDNGLLDTNPDPSAREFQFTYDAESIIERMRAQTRANVYFATLAGDEQGAVNVAYLTRNAGEIDPADVGNDNMRNVYRHNSQGQFVYRAGEYSRRGRIDTFDMRLERLNIPSGVAAGSRIYKYDRTRVDTLGDFNRHTIIVFQVSETDNRFSNKTDWDGRRHPNYNVNVSYHHAVYEQLSAILNRLSYDFYMVNGQLPRMNLIGHSRGGLVNTMFATSHPHQVASMQSVGTPYFNIRLAQLLDRFPIADALIPIFMGIDNMFFSRAAEDFLNDRMNNAIRTRWNNTISRPDVEINATAFGTAASADYIRFAMREDGMMDNFIFQLVYGFLAIMDTSFMNRLANIPIISTVVRTAMLAVFEIVMLYLVVNLAPITFWIERGINYTNLVLAVSSSINALIQSFEDNASYLNIYIEYHDDMTEEEQAEADEQALSAGSIIAGIINAIDHTYPLTRSVIGLIGLPSFVASMFSYTQGMLIFEDDIFIDLNSQLAPGYQGFDRHTKIFTSQNVNMSRRTSNMPISLHGLQTMDREFIDMMSFNIIESRGYEINTPKLITESVPGGLKVIGTNSMYGMVRIPAYIYFVRVVEVAENAFAENNITRVYIGKNVLEIRNNAFAQNTGLTALVFDRNSLAQSICENAFAGSTLETVENFPETIVHVGINNFSGTNWLKNQMEGNSLFSPAGNNFVLGYKIDTMNYTLTIAGEYTIFSDFSIVRENQIATLAQIILGEAVILHDYAFAGEQFRILDINVQFIPDFAFVDNMALESISFGDNVRFIGVSAFSGATSLQSLRLSENLAAIGGRAFFGNINLIRIDASSTVPPLIASDTFGNTNTALAVFVRGISRDLYRAAWSSIGSSRIRVETATIILRGQDGRQLGFVSVDYHSHLASVPVIPGYRTDVLLINGIEFRQGALLNFDLFTLQNHIEFKLIPIVYTAFILNGNQIVTTIEFTIEDEKFIRNYVNTNLENFIFTGFTDENGVEIQWISQGTIGNIHIQMNFRGVPRTILISGSGYTFNTEFGLSFSVPSNMIPGRPGYVFEGFYTLPNGSGVRVTDAYGYSITPFLFDGDVILHPRWRPLTFILNIGGGYTYGHNGVTNWEQTVDFGDNISIQGNPELLQHFARSGHSILYFFDAVTGQKIQWTNGVPILGGDGTTLTIMARYEVIIYTVVLNFGHSNLHQTLTFLYNANLTFLNPTNFGHSFSGWFKDCGLRFSFTRMPALPDGIVTVNLTARWTAGQYTVVFQSMPGINYAVRIVTFGTFFDFHYIAPTRVGFDFTGWTSNINGVLLSGVWSTDSNVIFTANWQIRNYIVRFHHNIGIFNPSPNPFDSFRLFNVQGQVIFPTPVKDIHIFRGWRCDDDGEIHTMLPVGSVGDRRFTAVWERNILAFSATTVNVISDNRALDFRNRNAATVFVINIDASVTRIMFIGSQNVFFNVTINAAGNTLLTMYFENFWFTARQGANGNPGASGSNGITATHRNLDIFYIGVNRITGGAGGSGIAGTSGRPGTIGRNAGNGGHGIVARNVTIVNRIGLSGSLTITGGRGGHGGQGGAGLVGAPGARNDTGNGTGDHGQDGGNGGQGGSGGTGGFAIQATQISISANNPSTVNVTLIGGSGGQGGDGGQGGNGGRGHDGRNASGLNRSLAGGNGGRGGNGGNGGNAGSGARATSGLLLERSFTSREGSMGFRGIGGVRGVGGGGGLGGSGNIWWNNAPNGSPGIGGTGGTAGQGQFR